MTPTVPAVIAGHVRFDDTGLPDVDESQVLVMAGMGDEGLGPNGEALGLQTGHSAREPRFSGRE